MILDEIFSQSRKDLAIKKEEISYQSLEKLCVDKKPKNVISALKKSQNKFNIIAEVKKASPSKGVIREDFNPLSIAQNYEKNEAAALSVLTQKHYFMGDLAFLQGISKSAKVPILRKDFIFDEYQILESLAFGADFILLIARVFDEKELKRLADFAKGLKLEILFEIHNQEDLQKSLFANAHIIGVNHRDLSDFSMNMKLCEELLPQIPPQIIKVAESGLDNKSVLLNLDDLGVDAFLIGEYFMRQNDEGKALKAFVQR